MTDIITQGLIIFFVIRIFSFYCGRTILLSDKKIFIPAIKKVYLSNKICVGWFVVSILGSKYEIAREERFLRTSWLAFTRVTPDSRRVLPLGQRCVDRSIGHSGWATSLLMGRAIKFRSIPAFTPCNGPICF